VDRTLHNTLVEVPLYIEASMGPTVGCQQWGTYYRCCFVSTADAYFVEEAVVVGVAVAETLALRAHVPVGEAVVLPAASLLELLFLVQSIAPSSEIF
jgi:hypothetical protein